MNISHAMARSLGLTPTNPVHPPKRMRESRAKRDKTFVPLEKDIQRAILQYLRARGVWAVRINSAGVKLPGRGGKAGFYRSNDRDGCPDVLCCVAGRFVAIEVKRPGKIPTRGQDDCHEDIRSAGGEVIVATGIDDVSVLFN